MLITTTTNNLHRITRPFSSHRIVCCSTTYSKVMKHNTVTYKLLLHWDVTQLKSPTYHLWTSPLAPKITAKDNRVSNWSCVKLIKKSNKQFYNTSELCKPMKYKNNVTSKAETRCNFEKVKVPTIYTSLHYFPA